MKKTTEFDTSDLKLEAVLSLKLCPGLQNHSCKLVDDITIHNVKFSKDVVVFHGIEDSRARLAKLE